MTPEQAALALMTMILNAVLDDEELKAEAAADNVMTVGYGVTIE